jgi:uncharacterized membrane protein YfbV (UPF0208 family)
LDQLDKLYSSNWQRTVDTFMVEITTSVSQVFRAPAEQSLKDALAEAFQQLDQQKAANQTAEV